MGGGDRVVCNLDCFNCPYPDCIRSENQDSIDWQKNNPEKRKAIRRRYYLKNREREKEYQRSYHQEVKDTEEYKAMKQKLNKKYRQDNLDKLKQKDREYYLRNREKRLEYARKYREKQKAVS